MAFLTLLMPLFNQIIGKIFPDTADQVKAQSELIKAISEADTAEWDAKSKILVAEI